MLNGEKASNINENVIYYVDLALTLLNIVGYNVSTYLLKNRKWHPRLVLILGSCLSLSGYFMSSFTTTFKWFIVCYGVIGALGCGIIYFVPLVTCWDHCPTRKGLISGIIVGSYGLGSMIWTFIGKAISNPDDLEPTIVINKHLKYFDARVANNVPAMLRTLCFIWAIQMIIAIVLMDRPQ